MELPHYASVALIILSMVLIRDAEKDMSLGHLVLAMGSIPILSMSSNKGLSIERI